MEEEDKIMGLNIVTFGGGTGQRIGLRALSRLKRKSDKITAGCPGSDTGGSTGVFILEGKGKGYIGDVVKSYAGLTPDPDLAKFLTSRHVGGHLDGDTGGNLLFVSLEQALGTEKALRKMNRMFKLGRNQVLPVTLERTSLVATYATGARVIGETNIDKITTNPLWNPRDYKITNIELDPPVVGYSKFIDEIKRAHVLIGWAGDLYTSVLSTILPIGIKEAIMESLAPIIVLVNLMVKRGETDNYRFEDYRSSLELRLGRSVDLFLVNSTQISWEAEERYRRENKHAPELIRSTQERGDHIRLCPLLEELPNGLIRHDEKLLAQELEKILQDKRFIRPTGSNGRLSHVGV